MPTFHSAASRKLNQQRAPQCVPKTHLCSRRRNVCNGYTYSALNYISRCCLYTLAVHSRCRYNKKNANASRWSGNLNLFSLRQATTAGMWCNYPHLILCRKHDSTGRCTSPVRSTCRLDFRSVNQTVFTDV